MKTFSTRKVVSALRRFNLRPASKGCGSGHSLWVNDAGRVVQAVTRKKDMNIESVFSLANDLEAKGICSRREFMKSLRNA